MALKQSDFDFIRQMIQKRAAIVLDDNKHYFVESRLGPVVEETGSKSMDHLIEQLRSSSHSALQQKVTEAITIHETSFFRDMHPFKALRESVFPDIIQKRGSDRAISMWCGACSSGQEPYTVSMI